MSRILVIEPDEQLATFKDAKNTMSVRFNSINIKKDKSSRLYEADMNFDADLIEFKQTSHKLSHAVGAVGAGTVKLQTLHKPESPAYNFFQRFFDQPERAFSLEDKLNEGFKEM